jgi:hypothetical protein
LVWSSRLVGWSSFHEKTIITFYKKN